MEGIAGKVIIVTGASSGIGEASALQLGAGGATIVATARRDDRLRDLEARITAVGGTVLAFTTDITDEPQVRTMVQRTMERFARIDVLVNNAGVMHNAPISAAHTDDWRRMLDANVLGLAIATQAVLPMMRAQGGGHIVNISSVAGRVFSPSAAMYAATKAGVVGFSEALRKEVYKDRIRVTVVEPGVTATELPDHISDAATQAGFRDWMASMRPLQSEDIARAIVFAIAQPSHVGVNEIMIRPVDQER